MHAQIISSAAFAGRLRGLHRLEQAEARASTTELLVLLLPACRTARWAELTEKQRVRKVAGRQSVKDRVTSLPSDRGMECRDGVMQDDSAAREIRPNCDCWNVAFASMFNALAGPGVPMTGSLI